MIPHSGQYKYPHKGEWRPTLATAGRILGPTVFPPDKSLHHYCNTRALPVSLGAGSRNFARLSCRMTENKVQRSMPYKQRRPVTRTLPMLAEPEDFGQVTLSRRLGPISDFTKSTHPSTNFGMNLQLVTFILSADPPHCKFTTERYLG